MKITAFIDDLKALGVRVENGTKHYKLYYNGRQSTCPRHPGAEISPMFAKKIKKQLGLE